MRLISFVLMVTMILSWLVCPLTYGQERVVEFKDPAWAFIWGVVFPGGGQYYNGQTADGTKELIWESLIGIVSISAIAGSILLANPSQVGLGGLVGNQGEATLIALAAGGAVLFVVGAMFRMASAFKAVEDARKINRGELRL